MYQAWARKQERLQAEQQEQLFLRECGRLEEILAAQEAGPVPPSHSAQPPAPPFRSPLSAQSLSSCLSGFFSNMGQLCMSPSR